MESKAKTLKYLPDAYIKTMPCSIHPHRTLYEIWCSKGLIITCARSEEDAWERAAKECQWAAFNNREIKGI